MAFEAIVNREGAFKVILQERPEGVYVFLFEKPGSRTSVRDNLQDTLEIAKRTSFQDYGVTEDMWREIPETDLMAR